MKKILMLFTDMYNHGGIQQYNRNLSAALASTFPDDRFTIISLHDSPDAICAEKSDNIKIKFCGHLNSPWIRKAAFITETLYAYISHRPAFLICGHVDLSPLAFFMKKIFGLKYALLTHGTDVWTIKAGIKYMGFKNADMILTVSRYTKAKLVSNGVDARKIRYLPNAVDMSLFYPKDTNHMLRQKLGLINKRVLLTVGRMHPDEKYKGHDIMLDVLGKLDKKYTWLVVGSGEDLPRLRKKAIESGVSDRVIFLGEVSGEELCDYYNLCDCFIMPSKGEGFGIVFLEALACGKCVIAGNKDASLEPLMGGRLGFTVDPDDFDSITKTIDSVFNIKDGRTDPK